MNATLKVIMIFFSDATKVSKPFKKQKNITYIFHESPSKTNSLTKNKKQIKLWHTTSK